MKKLVLAFMLVILIGYTSLNAAPPEEQTFQEIHEITLSKDAIFEKSLEWMTQTLADSKQVIELQDKKNGKIIGKGMTTFYNGDTPTPCRFTMMIEVKDNKYRVTYSNFIGMWGAARNLPRPLWHAGHIEQVKAKLKELDTSLYSYISKKENGKDW